MCDSNDVVQEDAVLIKAPTIGGGGGGGDVDCDVMLPEHAAGRRQSAAVDAEEDEETAVPTAKGLGSAAAETHLTEADDLHCYEMLGVARNAVFEDIKRAYKRRALKLHPDKGGDGLSFARLCRAYNILSDRSKREAFDAGGISAVAVLEDESLRCRLEVHFSKAMQATLAAAGLIFLDPEVLHPRFAVVQKTRKVVRRSGAGGFGGGTEDGGGGGNAGGQDGLGTGEGNGKKSDIASSKSRRKANFHLYTASPLRVHASLVKEYPFVREFWPTPASFSPLVVGNLSVQAYALMACVQVSSWVSG